MSALDALLHEASYVYEDRRPWIDLDAGMYHRLADGEAERRNKRASDAWVARVTGTDPRFHLARRFLAKDAEHVTHSGRSGWFKWVLRSPGYYEIRNFQYAAGEASIGRLDREFLKVDEASAVTRVTKDHVIAAMQALEAA